MGLRPVRLVQFTLSWKCKGRILINPSQNGSITAIANHDMPPTVDVKRQCVVGVCLDCHYCSLDQCFRPCQLEVRMIDVPVTIDQPSDKMPIHLRRDGQVSDGIGFVGMQSERFQLGDKELIRDDKCRHFMRTITRLDENRFDGVRTLHGIADGFKNRAIRFLELDTENFTGAMVSNPSIGNNHTKGVCLCFGVNRSKEVFINGILSVPDVTNRGRARQAVLASPIPDGFLTDAIQRGDLWVIHCLQKELQYVSIFVRHRSLNSHTSTENNTILLRVGQDRVRPRRKLREAGGTETACPFLVKGRVTNEYDTVLLERALPNLLHLQWAQKRPLPRNTGKSIEFRRFNSLPEATTALTEGTPSNQQNMNVSNVTASISQYGSYVTFTDLVEETTFDPYLTETAQVLGEQAGSTVDILVRNVITSGTNVLPRAA